MDMQASLRARLKAAAPVTALVGTRIDWMLRPQGKALPAISLQTISDPRPQHMKGFQDLRATRVQIDVWGETYASVKEIRAAVVAALAPEETSNGVRFGRSFVENVRDLGEQTETAFIHRTAIDLIVHHAAA